MPSPSSEIAASGMVLSAPDEAGKWSLWALTLASSGLRFSSPVTVNVFRPLQAEFRLPASLRVGESLEVDVKIGNNINSCMDVSISVAYYIMYVIYQVNVCIYLCVMNS